MESRYIVDRDMVRHGERDWEKEKGCKEREFWLTDESVFRYFPMLRLGSKTHKDSMSIGWKISIET